MTTQTQTTYEVVDTQTKKVVGTFNSRRRASNMADRKDAAYGAVRYVVVPKFAQ